MMKVSFFYIVGQDSDECFKRLKEAYVFWSVRWLIDGLILTWILFFCVLVQCNASSMGSSSEARKSIYRPWFLCIVILRSCCSWCRIIIMNSAQKWKCAQRADLCDRKTMDPLRRSDSFEKMRKFTAATRWWLKFRFLLHGFKADFKSDSCDSSSIDYGLMWLPGDLYESCYHYSQI